MASGHATTTTATLDHSRSMPLRRTPKTSLHQFIGTSASDLRVQHLHRASAWAASAVPSLGAFLGARLAATCETLAVPSPTDLSCKRCCSLLQPGLNCEIQIKRASRKKLKLLSANGVEEKRTIYNCRFCGFHNVKAENSKSFKSENIIVCKSTEKLSEKSPYATPRAFTKTPDTRPVVETPFSLSLANSTGSGKKRKRQGWLTLSERTKLQHNDQSPHVGRLIELAGAGTITTMPGFQSPEPQYEQLGNSVTSDVTDTNPQNNHNLCIVPQSETSDLQEIILSNLASICSGPGPLVVEPPDNNCSQPANLDLVEACHDVYSSEATIYKQNIISSDSVKLISISDDPNEQTSKTRSEQILDQKENNAFSINEAFRSHEVLMVDLLSEDVFRTQELSMVDMDLEEVPNSQEFSMVPEALEKPGAANHDDVASLDDSESSGGLFEAKLSPQASSQNNAISEEGTEIAPNILSKEVDSETPDVSNLDILKISDVVGMDPGVEIGDLNATDLQKEPQFSITNGPPCFSDVVKQLPEVSKVALSAMESEELAYEAKNNLVETGVQCSLFPQEVELPCDALHSKDKLKETAVQCCLSTQEVEVPCEALHLETSYKRRVEALSLALKRSTRAFISSKKLQEARHFLYRKNLKHQMEAQLLELQTYKQKISKYKNKLRIMNASRREKIRPNMPLSKLNPLWRQSNMVGTLTVITSLKRRLRIIPILREHIGDLSKLLTASLETASDALARGIKASGPSDHVEEFRNPEVSDLKVLTVSPRNLRKAEMHTPDDVKVFLVSGSKPVTKEPLQCIVSNKAPILHIEQDPYLQTSPKQLIEGFKNTTMFKPWLDGNSKTSVPCADISMFDAKGSQNLALLSAMNVDSMEEIPTIEKSGAVDRVENLNAFSFKQAVSMSQVSKSPLLMESDKKIQKSRRKVLLDNTIWNCLQARFPNFQPVESVKARSCLYKLGRKWRVGVKWRKSH